MPNRPARLATLFATAAGTALAIAPLTGCGSAAKSASARSSTGARPTVSDAEQRYLEADDRLFENPYDAQALADRAAALRDMNEADAAKEDAQLALVRDPNNRQARDLLEELSPPPQQQAEPEPEAEPEPVAVAMETETEAEPETEPVVEAEPEPEPSALDLAMARAREAVAQPDYFLALAALDDALAIDPGHVPAIELKGSVYNQQERYSDAVRVLAPLSPRSPSASTAYAYASLKNQDFSTAITELTALIESDGPDPVRLMYRGLAHYYQGDTTTAAQDLSQALEIAPADWPYTEYTQRVLERAGG